MIRIERKQAAADIKLETISNGLMVFTSVRSPRKYHSLRSTVEKRSLYFSTNSNLSEVKIIVSED